MGFDAPAGKGAIGMAERKRLAIADFADKAHLAERLHARVGLTCYSTVEFLIALVLLLVVTPLVEGLSHAAMIEGVLLTLVLGSAVLAGIVALVGIAIIRSDVAIDGEGVDVALGIGTSRQPVSEASTGCFQLGPRRRPEVTGSNPVPATPNSRSIPET